MAAWGLTRKKLTVTEDDAWQTTDIHPEHSSGELTKIVGVIKKSKTHLAIKIHLYIVYLLYFIKKANNQPAYTRNNKVCCLLNLKNIYWSFEMKEQGICPMETAQLTCHGGWLTLCMLGNFFKYLFLSKFSKNSLFPPICFADI